MKGVIDIIVKDGRAIVIVKRPERTMLDQMKKQIREMHEDIRKIELMDPLSMFEQPNLMKDMFDGFSLMSNKNFFENFGLQKFTRYTYSLEHLDNSKKALLLSKIAGVKLYQEEDNKALELYKEAAMIYGDSGDLQNTASCLSNIGRIYEKMNEYSNALKTFEETLKIDEELGDIAGIASDHFNLGKIYELCGDFSDAINSYEKSVSLLIQ